MGPRKRAKPNPQAEADTPADAQAVPAPQPVPPGIPPSKKSSGYGEAAYQASHSKTLDEPSGGHNKTTSIRTPNRSQSNKSWYGGSWPRVSKAAPVTEVAKESISAASDIAAEVVSSARARVPQSPALNSPSLRHLGSSTRSLPLSATTTKLNITSSASAQSGKDKKKPSVLADSTDEAVGNPPGQSSSDEARPELSPYRNSHSGVQEDQNVQQASVETMNKPPLKEDLKDGRGGWFGWFTKPEGTNDEQRTASDGKEDIMQPEQLLVDPPQIPSVMNANSEQTPVNRRRSSDPSPIAAREQPTRSWLKLWGSAAPSDKDNVDPASGTVNNSSSKISSESRDVNNVSTKSSDGQTSSIEDPTATKSKDLLDTSDTAKSSGWAFWSRDYGNSKVQEGTSKGELAVAGSPSQSQPENAIVDEAKGLPRVTNKAGKRDRPQSLELADDGKTTERFANHSTSSSATQAPLMSSKEDLTDSTPTRTPKPAVNLILPTFRGTYRVAENPSLLQQLSQLFTYSKTVTTKHVSLSQDLPRIKKALAVGVHGYFPTPLIRSVLGQPTGTSIRFAESAASAIQQWTQDHGYSCEIEKVALEGEGKIAERIDLLWKLLLNWIEDIRQSDFILVACHSQGVPVAMMLVAKLIAFGCVNAARIGVCAMAGVNLGPFADYKSRWISGSAGELFEFAQPESQVSQDYRVALGTALKFGVRIVYIGSIDDQLVSLESSTFGPLNHPYIYRAVFVDGRIHAPDFLTHLVGFALKLRNLGISDHGLIRELSSPLAGSLYSGEGHSRIYDDRAVYFLAVEHALETTSLGATPLQLHKQMNTTSQNPYILPFAMRGLLEEEFVRSELHDEVGDLLSQFDEWKPTTKVLKDVKFRLEGIRSRL